MSTTKLSQQYQLHKDSFRWNILFSVKFQAPMLLSQLAAVYVSCSVMSYCLRPHRV